MNKTKNYSNDPKILMFELRKRKKDVIFWGIAIFIILILVIFMSFKDISVLLALSGILKTLSFIIILVKVINYQNCSGLSVSSLTCFLIAFLCRKFVVIFFEFRLRNFRVNVVNSRFNNIAEFASLFLCAALVYIIYYKYPETSDVRLDNKIRFYYICIPVFIVAIPFKPYIYRNWFADLLWIYSMFLESVALYPQIRLFSVKKGLIENFTSQYLILHIISTLYGICFWYQRFYKFNDRDSLLLGGYSGYLIMVSEIIKLVSMGYYVYLFCISFLKTYTQKKYDL